MTTLDVFAERPKSETSYLCTQVQPRTNGSLREVHFKERFDSVLRDLCDLTTESGGVAEPSERVHKPIEVAAQNTIQTNLR